MIRTRKAPLAAIALALFEACRAAPEAPRPPLPEGAQGVLSALDLRSRETETLQALFRVTARRGAEAQSSRGALVVTRPDRLRLQLFSFGVMTVFDYTASGDRFRVRRPLEGETRVGRFSEGGAEREDLAAWDLRPLFFRAGAAEGRVEDGGDAWEVVFEGPSGRRRLTVSKRDATVETETVLAGDTVELRARYADYRPVEGTPLPFRIEVEYPARSMFLEIDVTRYTRNQPVDDSLFEF
ncbi:MAG: LolA family protein [Candidatus Binatia bacterium]